VENYVYDDSESKTPIKATRDHHHYRYHHQTAMPCHHHHWGEDHRDEVADLLSINR